MSIETCKEEIVIKQKSVLSLFSSAGIGELGIKAAELEILLSKVKNET